MYLRRVSLFGEWLLYHRQWRDTLRPYIDDAFNTDALWNWFQKKAMVTPPPIFGIHKTVTPGKAKAKGIGNGAPDTTKASGAVQVKKAKIAAVPTTSATKFCLANAFQYLGPRPGHAGTLQCLRGSRSHAWEGPRGVPRALWSGMTRGDNGPIDGNCWGRELLERLGHYPHHYVLISRRALLAR